MIVLSSEHKLLFIHHKFSNTKRAGKLNCIATRISKVTESRWVGPSAGSRCFKPSRSKNSHREDGGAETMLGLATFLHFLDESRPTWPSDMGRWNSMGCDTDDRSLCLLIQTRRKIIHGSHWQRMVQTVLSTTVQLKHAYARMHKNSKWYKHSLCIITRLVQIKLND